MPDSTYADTDLALGLADIFEEAGYVCVPAEPTPVMITAAQAVASIDEATVRAVYRAMVAEE